MVKKNTKHILLDEMRTVKKNEILKKSNIKLPKEKGNKMVKNFNCKRGNI